MTQAVAFITRRRSGIDVTTVSCSSRVAIKRMLKAAVERHLARRAGEPGEFCEADGNRSRLLSRRADVERRNNMLSCYIVGTLISLHSFVFATSAGVTRYTKQATAPIACCHRRISADSVV